MKRFWSGWYWLQVIVLVVCAGFPDVRAGREYAKDDLSLSSLVPYNSLQQRCEELRWRDTQTISFLAKQLQSRDNTERDRQSARKKLQKKFAEGDVQAGWLLLDDAQEQNKISDAVRYVRMLHDLDSLECARRIIASHIDKPNQRKHILKQLVQQYNGTHKSYSFDPQICFTMNLLLAIESVKKQEINDRDRKQSDNYIMQALSFPVSESFLEIMQPVLDAMMEAGLLDDSNMTKNAVRERRGAWLDEMRASISVHLAQDRYDRVSNLLNVAGSFGDDERTALFDFVKDQAQQYVEKLSGGLNASQCAFVRESWVMLAQNAIMHDDTQAALAYYQKLLDNGTLFDIESEQRYRWADVLLGVARDVSRIGAPVETVIGFLDRADRLLAPHQADATDMPLIVQIKFFLAKVLLMHPLEQSDTSIATKERVHALLNYLFDQQEHLTPAQINGLRKMSNGFCSIYQEPFEKMLSKPSLQRVLDDFATSTEHHMFALQPQSPAAIQIVALNTLIAYFTEKGELQVAVMYAEMRAAIVEGKVLCPCRWREVYHCMDKCALIHDEAKEKLSYGRLYCTLFDGAVRCNAPECASAADHCMALMICARDARIHKRHVEEKAYIMRVCDYPSETLRAVFQDNLPVLIARLAEACEAVGSYEIDAARLEKLLDLGLAYEVPVSESVQCSLRFFKALCAAAEPLRRDEAYTWFRTADEAGSRDACIATAVLSRNEEEVLDCLTRCSRLGFEDIIEKYSIFARRFGRQGALEREGLKNFIVSSMSVKFEDGWRMLVQLDACGSKWAGDQRENFGTYLAQHWWEMIYSQGLSQQGFLHLALRSLMVFKNITLSTQNHRRYLEQIDTALKVKAQEADKAAQRTGKKKKNNKHIETVPTQSVGWEEFIVPICRLIDNQREVLSRENVSV